MAHSRDYYHSSSRSSKRSDSDDIKQEERLPSLRHVVGDAYHGRAPSAHDAYDFHDVKHSLPRVSNDPYSNHSSYDKHGYSQRGPTLAPIYSGSASNHGTHSTYPSHSAPRRGSHQPASGSSRTRSNADHSSSQDYSYQAFYSSKRGDLVPVSTSSRPLGVIRNSALPDEDDDPRKKYKCPECNKGFDRPSGVDTHLLTHNGERPYVCPISHCGKTFGVKSNMNRHVRTQHQGVPDDADERHASSHHSTYSGTSRGSSDKSSPPSASYYARR